MPFAYDNADIITAAPLRAYLAVLLNLMGFSKICVRVTFNYSVQVVFNLQPELGTRISVVKRSGS